MKLIVKFAACASTLLAAGLFLPHPIAAQWEAGSDGATIAIGMHLMGLEQGVPSSSSEPANVGFAATWFDLRIPLSVNGGRTTITNKFFWRHLDKEYLGWADFPSDEDLIVHSNSYRYTLAVSHLMSSGITITTRVSPEMKSNLDLQVDGSRSLVSGSAHAERQLTENVMLGLGAHYGRTFGRPHLHPAVALRWTTGRGVMVEGFLPEYLGVRFLPLHFLELGIEGRIDGDEFVGNAEVYGADDARVQFWNATFGATARVHFTSSANLFLAGGTTVRRSMEVKFPDGARNSFDPSGAGYVQAGLSLGLR